MGPIKRFVLWVPQEQHRTSFALWRAIYCKEHLFPSEIVPRTRTSAHVSWEVPLCYTRRGRPCLPHAPRVGCMSSLRSYIAHQFYSEEVYPTSFAYMCSVTRTPILFFLHYTLSSRELIPSLKVPVSHCPWGPDFLLKGSCVRGPNYLPKDPFVLKILVPSSRSLLRFYFPP